MRQVAWATEFCTVVAPNICVFIMELASCRLLESRLLKWLPDFWKIEKFVGSEDSPFFFFK